MGKIEQRNNDSRLNTETRKTVVASIKLKQLCWARTHRSLKQSRKPGEYETLIPNQGFEYRMDNSINRVGKIGYFGGKSCQSFTS
jgi:hypothetical protein